ncbi:3-isopropylmalate dehydratase small subunit [Billgrantia aerodenitrificans]|uniref:3-isopropylmalate dehydratase n=1 Tax=Billgrantia aerodenitrificans TaxID=2733483 RepID=A0ABS9AUV0_9GAMM|nr:3-isopropylmalate dehydratase small subunit [Halomonas aerodenitrificans]MCE8025300.1 3-isopropylmalate dehydratase small subunit [Halomonas aerodenitrificans]
MEPIKIIDAPACPLPLANVDTDQLIPARFMKEPRSVGYGRFLLHDLRHDESGRPVEDFILNHPQAGEAKTLVARRNFGAGSSREAAVYALVDFGFRCVIAPSFGDIFASNAVNNGLLPATVSEADAETLLAALGEAPGALHVDLEAQRITIGELSVAFSIAPTWRTKLLNGWDDIDMTRQHAEEIERFATRYASQRPWLDAAPPPLITRG